MIIRSALTALALSTALANMAGAEELKFANYMPAGHPYVGSTFQPFADAVAAATSNEVTVKLYNGGELGAGPVEQYGRVVDGVAELAVSLPGYTASNFPLTLLAELPGALDEASGTQELNDKRDLFAEEYKRAHLVSLWSNAENILFTATKPVRTLEDIKGMKIRVPSRNTGLLVEAWGASPVSLPVSEIYNALQTGVIDGAMIDGTGIGAFKLDEVSNYVTMGMQTTISPFFILMNRDAYDALTPEQQAAVDAAGKDAAMNGQASQIKGAQKGIEKFAAIAGKEVIRLSAEEAAPFNAVAAAVQEKAAAEIGDAAAPVIAGLTAQ